jgi:hypothetical protein
LTHKGALRTRLALFLALTVLTGGLWPLFRPTPVHAAVSTNAAALLLTAAGNAGTITAAQGDVRLNLIDAATAAVTISGTWVATVQFEGTVDGTNWVAVNAYVPSTLAAVTSTTANGTWIIPAAALGTIRVRSSAFTSGTIAVTIRNVGGSFVVPGGSGTVTATQGTPAADGSANAWKVQGAVAQAGTITGVNPVAIGINDGSSVLRYLAGINQANATPGNGIAAFSPTVWDGTNFQKQLQASAATGTAGTGLLGSGQMVFDLAGGTNYIRQAGDTSGRAMSVGAAANGAAVAGNPLLIAGSDATNARSLLTDTSGRLNMVGAAASGAAVAGNPLLMGISDGTNVQIPKQITSATATTGTGLLGTGPALFDTVGGTNYVRQAGDGSGRAMVVGAGASGSALVGNPILIAGSDATNARSLLTDTSGRLVVGGAQADNAALAGNPLRTGLSDGTNIQSARQMADSVGAVAATGYGGAGLYLRVGAGDYRLLAAANAITDGNSGANSAAASGYFFNGSNWDRTRSNVNAIIHASAATGTGTVNTDVTNYNARFFTVHVNVTNFNGGTVLTKLQQQDANGVFTDIPGATTGAVATPNTDIFLTVGPNTWPANTAANFYANFPLPRLIRIVTTTATATVTFSNAYEMGGGF